MKTLSLLRHAKSGWDDPVERDFDRPLNPRGRRAARAVGREMRRLGLEFDLVLASPARRVVETLEEVAAAYGAIAPRFDERLYLASADTLLEAAGEAGDDVGRLLLVAHNPGLENLALRLSAGGSDGLRREVEAKYPTATLAEIALGAARWSEAGSGGGRVVRLIRPRDLDPALGPDGS
jgi:phosphohistidine phosphatase